jgi:hypothetical protein
MPRLYVRQDPLTCIAGRDPVSQGGDDGGRP